MKRAWTKLLVYCVRRSVFLQELVVLMCIEFDYQRRRLRKG